MKDNYTPLRKYLDEHLNKLTPDFWYEVCELFDIPIEIIREYKDFIYWEAIGGVIYYLRDKDLLREFKKEIEYEEGWEKKTRELVTFSL